MINKLIDEAAILRCQVEALVALVEELAPEAGTVSPWCMETHGRDEHRREFAQRRLKEILNAD